MTVDEIIMVYRQAKDPEKQIRIMADQCLCKPSEIRSMLREAGVYQAKVRKPRNQTQPSAPEKAAAQPATPAASLTPAALEAPEAPEAPKLEDIRPVTIHQEPEGFSVTVDRRTLTPALDELLMKGLEDQPHGECSAPRPLPLYDIKDIKASALDAIAEVYPKEVAEDPVAEGPVYDFAERVLGILMLVDKLEEQGGSNE